MRAIRRAAIMAATITLAFATPANTQTTWPMEPGDYVEVSMIEISDGHSLDYANHLAGQWRRGQDFAKAQGWITSYEVLSNVYARKGEPDIYLITRFARFADKAEDLRRDEAYRTHMQRTITQMQTESGDRAKYRTLGGSMLLRQMMFKN